MKFNISINKPTLPDEFYKTKYGWKFIEEDIDEEDSLFFTMVNYSFIEWKDGIRLSSNFVAAHGIVIDYDNKDGVITFIPEIKQYLDDLFVNYMVVNSKSHTPEVPRYHILLPFAEPITNTDTYSALITTVMSKLPGEPDGSVKDFARFMGYTPEDKLVEWHLVENSKFIDEVIIPTKREEKKITTQFKKAVKLTARANKDLTWECTDDLMSIVKTEQKHQINCPLDFGCHAHADENKSAFIAYNEQWENWYIYCSVCSPQLNGGHVFWMKRDVTFLKKFLLNN